MSPQAKCQNINKHTLDTTNNSICNKEIQSQWIYPCTSDQTMTQKRVLFFLIKNKLSLAYHLTMTMWGKQHTTLQVNAI